MGSERTWPENVWPTPEQWLPWFLSQPGETQLDIAKSVIQDSQLAQKCFERNHEGMHEEIRALRRLAMGEYERGRQEMAADMIDALDSNDGTDPAPALPERERGDE